MKPGTLILALSLVALAALTLAGSASACTAACQRVGGGIFCRQCVDTGTYTGATCENSGPCGCFYTHNTCGLGLAGIQTETRTADLGFLATPTPRRRSAPRRRPMRSRTDDWLPVGDDLLSGGDDRRRRRDDRLWPKKVCSVSATTFSLTETIVAVAETIVFGQRRFAPSRRRPSP